MEHSPEPRIVSQPPDTDEIRRRERQNWPPAKKLWEIWCEGYHVNEGKSPAVLFGLAWGDTFAEACIKYFETDKRRAAKEVEMYFKPDRLTYWGCRLFDNEADAREAFG